MINLKSVPSRIRKIKEIRRNQKILITIVILVLGALIYQQFLIKDILEDEIVNFGIRQVQTASVRDLTLDNTPLPLLGRVQSESQAEVFSQTSGEVIGLYKKTGDFVWADQIIAEIDNWAQRSAVIQAEASVEIATASLDKIKKGGRDEQVSILETTLSNSEFSLEEAKTAAVSALNDAHAKADDSVRNKIDIMFRDPRGDEPQVIFSVNNSQLEVDIEWGRFLVESVLNTWGEDLSSLDNNDDLETALSNAKDNINQIRSFLDKVAMAVNILNSNATLSETTINTWKANVSASRSVISATVSAISSTKNALNSARSALDIAQLNLEQATTGGRSEDVISAEAQLRQAEGGLQSAYAALEKTIIRSPISGTVNSLDIEKGDFVSAFSPVVTIANNSQLEIVTYITEVDRSEIAVNSEVLIGKKWKGNITNIAPALDSKTKKIKVEVAVQDKKVSLTNGQSVGLLVERVVGEANEELSEVSIPISAIKIGADKTVVFTVNIENTLTAHPVLVGPILGEKIIIKDGITEDMEIVIDARGLKDGQEVSLMPSLNTKGEIEEIINN